MLLYKDTKLRRRKRRGRQDRSKQIYREAAKALVVSELIVGVIEHGSNRAEFGR